MQFKIFISQNQKSFLNKKPLSPDSGFLIPPPAAAP